MVLAYHQNNFINALIDCFPHIGLIPSKFAQAQKSRNLFYFTLFYLYVRYFINLIYILIIVLQLLGVMKVKEGHFLKVMPPSILLILSLFPIGTLNQKTSLWRGRYWLIIFFFEVINDE